MKMDIRTAIDSIENDRDRKIAELIFVEDVEPQKVADKFDLSVDYVYTVKNRLVRKLKARLNGYC